MLDVVVRVQSSYFERTSSAYRLAITENTLIESLKHQNDKRFKVVLELCPLDPCYTLRRLAFDKIGVSVELEEQAVLQRRLEIRVDDDDYLHPSFVEAMRLPKENSVNTRLLCPSGYIFHDGKLSVWVEHPDIVDVSQIVEEDNDRTKQSLVVTRSPCWIHVRHKMNRSLLMVKITENEITRLNWDGWKQKIVQRYCETEMKTASAEGCELYPMRSKSVVFALNSARRRRKK